MFPNSHIHCALIILLMGLIPQPSHTTNEAQQERYPTSQTELFKTDEEGYLEIGSDTFERVDILSLPAEALRLLDIQSNISIECDGGSQDPILFANLESIHLGNCQVDTRCWAFGSKLETLRIVNVEFTNGSLYDFLKIPPSLSTLELVSMGKINLLNIPNRGNLRILQISASIAGCQDDICNPPVAFENVEEFTIGHCRTGANNFNFSGKFRKGYIESTNFIGGTFYDFLATIPLVEDLQFGYMETVDMSRLPTQNLKVLGVVVSKFLVEDDKVVFEKLEQLSLGTQGFSSREVLFTNFNNMFPVVSTLFMDGLITPTDLLSIVQSKSLESIYCLFDFKPPRKSFEFGESLRFFNTVGLDPNKILQQDKHWDDLRNRVLVVLCSREINTHRLTDEIGNFTCKVDLTISRWTAESVEYTKSSSVKLIVTLYFGVLYLIIGFGLFGNPISAYILIRANIMKTSSGLVLLSLTLSDSLIILTYLINSFFSASLFYSFFIESGTKAETARYSPEDHVWMAEQNEFQAYILYPINKTAYTASVYLTVLISLERFIAVCFPLKSKFLLSCKKSRYAILGVWIFTVIINSPRWIESYEWDNYDPNSPNWNEYFKPTFMRMKVYTFVYHRIMWPISMYLLPFILIGYFNYRLVKEMRKTMEARRSMTSGTTSEQTDSEMASLTNMLLTVVALFVICNAVHICIVLYFFLAFASIEPSTIEAIAGLPIIINSSVNFIIYVGMGKRFRNEFIKLIPQWMLSCASRIGLGHIQDREESRNRPSTNGSYLEQSL